MEYSASLTLRKPSQCLVLSMRDVRTVKKKCSYGILLYDETSEELEAKPVGMNLIDLEAFVSAIDHGSVVAASAAAPDPVGGNPKGLKSRRCTWEPLLDRQTTPLRPTLSATETYEFARSLLSSVGDPKVANVDRRAIFAVAF
jgi:hypothetical protein